MDSRLVPLHHLFQLNGRLLMNGLDGLDDPAIRQRPGGTTNNAAFIAAHLVDARHYLCRYLGGDPGGPPFGGRLEKARSLDDVAENELPTLEEILNAWAEITPLLESRFEALSTGDLDAPSEQAFPIGDDTVLGGVTFLAQHEAYHVGQLALLRRFAGGEAVSYD